MFQFIKNFINHQRFNTKAKVAFTNFYRFAKESQTFREYCKQVHGIDCFMQNNVSKAQFKAITKNFSEGQQVLDIGCGTGHLTSYLASEYKLKANGVDLVASDEKFKEANFEITSLGENRYDLAVSFDGFYMLNDLKKTLEKIKKSLKPGGKFILTYTTSKDFTKTKLGKILKNEKYEIKDFTQDDAKFNLEAKRVLEKLEPKFVEEGNISTYRTKYHEIAKNVEAHESKAMKRYLVTISK